MTNKIWKITDGAEIKCSMGVCNSKLQVPCSHGSVIQGKNIAIITDNIPNINITGFKTCICGGEKPCIPVTVMPWMLSSKKFRIGKNNILISDCILPCMNGGVISITQSGQDESKGGR